MPIMLKGSRKFTVDDDTLHRLHITEGKSSFQISKEIGIGDRTIRKYLKTLGINRCKRDASLMRWNGTLDFKNLSEDEIQIIEGELLGDGNISLRCENSYPWYRHSSKHEAYLYWLQTQLTSLGWSEVTKTVHKQRLKNGNQVISYHLNSQVHPQLEVIRQKYYDENNVKSIPSDLNLTPLVLKHWFIGDGSRGMYSTGYKKGKQTRKIQTFICCHSFSRDSLDTIALPKLKQLGIDATVVGKPGQHRIRIAANSDDQFMRLVSIGQVPFCYRYKYEGELLGV
jgi:hypothetical protein